MMDIDAVTCPDLACDKPILRTISVRLQNYMKTTGRISRKQWKQWGRLEADITKTRCTHMVMRKQCEWNAMYMFNYKPERRFRRWISNRPTLHEAPLQRLFGKPRNLYTQFWIYPACPKRRAGCFEKNYVKGVFEDYFGRVIESVLEHLLEDFFEKKSTFENSFFEDYCWKLF